MGVHGLWKLIEPAGKPVPVETLEDKILAVDVSIWLHQLVKGYQDSGGGTVANAHLLGLFHRICKLLYYKVKPIFVFDGGVPLLKKQTIAARRSQRNKADEISAKLREQILKNLIQQRAVGHASGSRDPASIPSHLLSQKEDDMFELPPVPSTSKEAEEAEGSDEEEYKPSMSRYDLQRIDVDSKEFKALPPDMRHDILSELKELRKQNSWRQIPEMPETLDDFSGFQLGRLMKRRNIQVSLEEAAKEMGGRTLSLGEMQKMFEEDGVITDAEVTQRIASDSSTRFVYIPGGKIPPGMLLNEPGPSSSKKVDYEEEAKEPEVPVKKADEELEVMKMIEEIEDEFSEGSEVDYISMKSESPEPAKDVDISDELSQAQILRMVQESNKANRFLGQSSSEKGTKQDGNQLRSTGNELGKKSGGAVKCIDSDKNFKSEAKCDNDTSAVFDDVVDENSDSQPKSNGYPSNASGDSKGRKPDSKEIGHHQTSDIIDKKNTGSGPVFDSSFTFKKSPKKERLSVDIDDESSLDEFVEVEDGKFEMEGNVTGQSPKKEKLSPKKEMVSPKKERISVGTSDSGSSSDEFVEVEEQSEMNSIYQKKKLEEFVQENIKKEKEKPCFEIVIEPSKCQVDSLFADIFTSSPPANTSSDKKADESDSEVKGSPEVLSKSNLKSNDNVYVEPIIKSKKPIIDNLNVEPTVKSKKLITDNVDVEPIVESKKPVTSNVDAEPSVKARKSMTDVTYNSEKSDVKINEISKVSPVKTGVKNKKTDEVSATQIGETEEVESDETSATPAATKGQQNQAKISDDVETSNLDAPVNDGKNKENSGQNDEDVPISEYTESKATTADSDASDSADDTRQEENLSQYFDAETLKNLQSELEVEQDKLLIERGKQERLATSITEQMNVDAQDLLQIFGIPYIIAPMEAEAQCAFLDAAMLTDGTITDDSDIWLFGGRKVFKNFFDQKKHVLSFNITGITHYFKLSRAQLIQLAYLVGSDYTPGLRGVGPVTAMEILSFFKESSEEAESRRVILSCLEKFKEWLKKPENIKAQCVFANKIKNLTIHEGFPNPAVVDAYLNPEVDSSNEGFSWAPPDLKALEEFVWAKFGWTKSKFDHLMNPVLKKISERTSQSTIDRFFQVLPSISAERGILSKRVKRAIGQLSGEVDPDEPAPNTSKRRKKTNAEKNSTPENDVPQTAEAPAPSSSKEKKKAKGSSSVPNDDESETPFDRRRKTLTSKNPQAARKRANKKSTETEDVPSTSQAQTTPQVPSVSQFPEDEDDIGEKSKSEVIPQREKDNMEKLKRKLKAVEIFNASKKNTRRKRRKTNMRRKGRIEDPSYLSESSDSN